MSGSQGAVNILQDSSSEEEEEGPFEDAHSPEEMSDYKGKVLYTCRYDKYILNTFSQQHLDMPSL